MLPTCHLIHYRVQLVGTALVLASLCGWYPLSAASAAGRELTASGDYPDYRDPHGYQNDRSYRRPRYEQPDRFTIRKGKKCEIHCERIRGTREYRCREYRC